MFKKASIVLLLVLCGFIGNAQATWFPKQKLFPYLAFDPTEKYSYICAGMFDPKKIIPYPYYFPFGFGISKSIVGTNRRDLSIEAAGQTQFGVRKENNIYKQGWRKSHLNTDYIIDLNFTQLIGKKFFFRASAFHRSTHLGDDYILLTGIKSRNYWLSDESTYETVSTSLMYRLGALSSYGKVAYVVRPDTERKRLELQAGFYFQNITKKGFLSKLLIGADARFLASNDFIPGLKSGIRFALAKDVHFGIEYYNGPIPYSRYERQQDISFFGGGFYFEPVF